MEVETLALLVRLRGIATSFADIKPGLVFKEQVFLLDMLRLLKEVRPEVLDELMLCVLGLIECLAS